MSLDNNLTVPINSINLWEQNPREISDKDFVSLKNKIKRWGLWRPFLVWKSKKRIIGGNQRYKAVSELGYKEIWVFYVEPANEAEALEMAIADNESSGEWIKSLLIEQIQLHQEEINLEDYKINIKDATLKDLMPVTVEEDDPPEEATINNISVLGDLYELNEHRVLCGDSTMIDQVDKLMNDAKVDMVFTDPPYGINLDTDYKGMPSRWNNEATYRNKFTKVKGDADKVDMAFIFNIPCKEIFVWGANFYTYSLPHYGVDGTWYVWDKRDDTNGETYDKMLTAPFELCWGMKKRGMKFIRMRWAGFMSDRNAEGERPIGRLHPTQKPIALAKWFVDKFSEKNGIVLDLFMGAGFTLLGCEKTDRRCYGMELDPHYIDVIVARYIKFMTDQNKPFTIKRNGEEIDSKIFIKETK